MRQAVAVGAVPGRRGREERREGGMDGKKDVSLRSLSSSPTPHPCLLLVFFFLLLPVGAHRQQKLIFFSAQAAHRCLGQCHRTLGLVETA